MFEVADGFADGRHFGRAQHYRELLLVPRGGNMFNHPLAVEDLVREKAQGAHRLIEQRPRGFFLLDQEQLIFSDVLGPEPIWWESKC